jgi:hypothetical protein
MLPAWCLAFVICICVGRTALAKDTPFSLRAEPTAVDFGEVVQQRVLEAKVNLINSENRSEVILSVTTDCGCTAASVLKETLAPGESTTLTIKVETRVQSGDIRRTVIVHANSGDLAIPVRFSVSPVPASSTPDQLP